MECAFVLINCDLGSENSIIDELAHLNSVKEIHGIFGAYDILAKVESENSETLKRTITDQIRKMEHIRSTLTLLETANAEKTSQMAGLIPDVIPDEKKPLEPPGEIEEDIEDDYDDDDDFDDKDVSQKKKRYKALYRKRYRDQV